MGDTLWLAYVDRQGNLHGRLMPELQVDINVGLTLLTCRKSELRETVNVSYNYLFKNVTFTNNYKCADLLCTLAQNRLMGSY